MGDGNSSNGNSAAAVTLNNTILANTIGGTDFFRQAINGGTSTASAGVNNSVESKGPSGNGYTGGIASSADPQLGALADNGGPTFTRVPAANSPAIDAGASGAGIPTMDQRGVARAGIPDIGALEVNNNQAPTDIGLSASSVAENLPSGTVVGTLSTTDPDAGDTHTYSLVGGDTTAFTLDAGGNLKTAASFDFEAKSSYSVRVQSTDAGGLSTEKDFTLSVINVNETPTVSVPAAQTTSEDVDRAITGITVGDPTAAA